MTPYIVRDEADIEMVKQMESQRMSWCLADVVSVHGEHNLNTSGNSHLACWDDGPTKVIYPDLMPTVPSVIEAPERMPSPAPLNPTLLNGAEVPENSGVHSASPPAGVASPAGFYSPAGASFRQVPIVTQTNHHVISSLPPRQAPQPTMYSTPPKPNGQAQP